MKPYIFILSLLFFAVVTAKADVVASETEQSAEEAIVAEYDDIDKPKKEKNIAEDSTTMQLHDSIESVKIASTSTPTTPATTKVKKPKSPTLATVLSACVPGAGQIYNGHWWKVPIIYGAAAGLTYVWWVNNKEYQIFKNEYKSWVENGHGISDAYQSLLQPQIKEAKDYYRRNLELTYIGFGLVYVLNIIDACVFAHLHSFDVSEDLSLQIKPSMQPLTIPVNGTQMTTGLTLNFTFK
ncbi:hypothetical protein FACS1894178_2030 [Bacteroidia bacterium]|nr:hypothetical protein FACS1894178_2030 [Bacteroidia bacterium]